MANNLAIEKVEAARTAFLESGSVRGAAKAAGITRQTVRRLVHRDGLVLRAHGNTSPTIDTPPQSFVRQEPDFALLKRMLCVGESRFETANRDLAEQVINLGRQIVAELGVVDAADVMRVETCLVEYLSYRRFRFKSLSASDECFRSMREMMKVVSTWDSMATSSLNNFTRLARELEIKHRRPVPQIQNLIFAAGNVEARGH